jgi:hypothetical protein
VSFDTVYGKRAMLLLAGPAASAPAGQRTAELRQPRPVNDWRLGSPYRNREEER